MMARTFFFVGMPSSLLRACMRSLCVTFLCGVAGPAAGEPAPLRIGMSLSQTGSFAALGTMQGRGCRLWAREVNGRGGILGRRVELAVHDDQSQPERAKAIYEDMIAKGEVDHVIGPYSSVITAAVAPVTERHGYPMLAAGASGDELWSHGYRHLFGLYSLTSRYAIGMLELLAEAGVERIGIISVDDAGTLAVANGARRWARAHGLQVTSHAVVKPELSLEQTVAEARRTGAQALIFAGRLDDGVRLRRVLAAMAWSPVVYVSAGAALPRFGELLGRDANGTFGTSLWEPRPDLRYPGSPDFLSTFSAAYGEPPSYHAALCFAAGQLLEQAMLKAGSADRAAVNAALASLDGMSIIGRYAVDRSGAQTRGFALIVQWQGNKREIVWPPELRTAKPVFDKTALRMPP
jgi:branched-chain amino acid transport system substrate-binding protein